MPSGKFGPRGHTLIELLLVLSLIVVTMVAAGTSFTMGAKLFRRISVSADEENTMLFLTRLTADLRNSVTDEERPFTMKPADMTFAVLHEDEQSGARGEASARPFQIRYFWDAESRTVTRILKDVYFKAMPDRQEVVLDGVSEFKLTQWSDVSGLPKQITVTFETVKSSGIHRFRKDILITKNFLESHA